MEYKDKFISSFNNIFLIRIRKRVGIFYLVNIYLRLANKKIILLY